MVNDEQKMKRVSLNDLELRDKSMLIMFILGVFFIIFLCVFNGFK